MIGYISLHQFYSSVTIQKRGDTELRLAVHDGKRVKCVSDPAESLGLRVGMSLTEARALGHGVTFVKLVPAEYLAASHEWLMLCLQATPKIEVGEPHEAWLDLSGHPCPEDVLDRLAEVLLVELGWSVEVGLAECKWVAKLACTHTRSIHPVPARGESSTYEQSAEPRPSELGRMTVTPRGHVAPEARRAFSPDSPGLGRECDPTLGSPSDCHLTPNGVPPAVSLVRCANARAEEHANPDILRHKEMRPTSSEQLGTTPSGLEPSAESSPKVGPKRSNPGLTGEERRWRTDGHGSASTYEQGAEPRPSDSGRMTVAPVVHSISKAIRRDVGTTLAPLPVRVLPIDPQHAERLEFLGYRTIGALRKASLSVLKSQFGKEGVRLAHLARGGSDGALVPNFPPDALTAERALEGGCEDREGLGAALAELALELHQGLVQRDVEGRTLMLWLELESGRVLGCERTFARSLRRVDSLRLSLGILLDSFELDEPVMRLRVMMPSLMKAGQGQAAFELMLSVDDKKSRAERALRHVRSVFGEGSVLPADEIPVERRVQVLRVWRESNGWR